LAALEEAGVGRTREGAPGRLCRAPFRAACSRAAVGDAHAQLALRSLRAPLDSAPAAPAVLEALLKAADATPAAIIGGASAIASERQEVQGMVRAGHTNP